MLVTRATAPDHEAVYRIEDTASGARGFIAIHSTRLGPAAGGLRMRAYDSEADALEDALRLSRGMTFKNAAAGLPLGGGKAVLMGDPARDKSPALLHAMGRAIDGLEGRYWTAEDMGMTPKDMVTLSEATPFVAGLPGGKFASGDPSPVTAEGVFRGIRIAARHQLGTSDLGGLSVAVQGLGHVGMHLCQLLADAGVGLWISDLDLKRVAEAVNRFRAVATDGANLLEAPVEIFVPCAIGGVLNKTTIPKLTAGIVAGAANNQLSEDADAARLAARNVLYVPDFVLNAGGIINVAAEILRVDDRARFVADKLSVLETTLDGILREAARKNVPPAALAEAIVARVLLSSAA
ncbi:MAG: Glu/Leu/Phe/Val dehydrogenase dimerization domain-containing protein [Pseudomonadota bacterium]